MRVLADARMEMRLSALDKKVLTQAAILLDTNASAFILNAALAEARRVLDSVCTVRLAPKDFRTFAADLAHPTPVTAPLARAQERLVRTHAVAGFEIEPLDLRQHGFEAFDTGLPPVDAFLRRRAASFERQGLSHTYVVPEARTGSRTCLLASYTLSKAEVRATSPRRREAGTGPAHQNALPVLRLSCLAVTARSQGRGLGELLVADTIERARTGLAPGTLAALLADTPDDDARRWYARFGFKALSSSPATAYLVLAAPDAQTKT